MRQMQWRLRCQCATMLRAAGGKNPLSANSPGKLATDVGAGIARSTSCDSTSFWIGFRLCMQLSRQQVALVEMASGE
jgi:hypothetical protein